MNKLYQMVLVYRDFSKDNIIIPFKCLDFQVIDAFVGMSYALNKSPFCKLMILADGQVLCNTTLTGDF